MDETEKINNREGLMTGYITVVAMSLYRYNISSDVIAEDILKIARKPVELTKTELIDKLREYRGFEITELSPKLSLAFYHCALSRYSKQARDMVLGYLAEFV